MLGLNELGAMYEAGNPARARQVYQMVIDMNYNFGGAVDRANLRLAALK